MMPEAQAREKGPRRFPLSSEELTDFNARGFIGPFTLFTPEEMKTHWKRERIQLFDRKNAVYADARPGSTLYNYDRHLDNDFLADTVCRAEIVDRVVSILGPDVLCWRSEFLPKYPGDAGHAWRQVFTFGALSGGIPHISWPNGPDFGGVVGAWLAFTEADEETGCLQFIPGTQHTLFYDESKGLRYAPGGNENAVNGILRGYFGYDWREIQVDPNWVPDESKAVSVPCRAGQFIIYRSRVLHASLPHPGRTNQIQLTWTVRYAQASVALYSAMKAADELSESGATVSLGKYGAVLVSGRNEYKHNRIRTHTTTGKPFINSNPG